MSEAAILLPLEAPCPRCSTEGIRYYHTPEVCERDWLRREQLTRIVTASVGTPDWWTALLAVEDES